MQVRRVTPFLGLVMLSTQAGAQAPAYDARSLGCAWFTEAVTGQLESRFGAERRQETFGREGILVVRAVPDSTGLSIEAWYDSLTVFREGPEGRLAPETDGILGGRYRGVLDPQGDYLSLTTPFVPSALREVFDFSRIPLHLFPPLSPTALRPGGEWTDGSELTIWRLSDSAGVGGVVSRYRWIRREVWEEGVAVGDSVVVVHRSEREDGGIQWIEGDGPVGWESAVVARLEFVEGDGLSEVRQQIRVRRLLVKCPDAY